jgi:Ca2+-binding EF-hand superfamily protein
MYADGDEEADDEGGLDLAATEAELEKSLKELFELLDVDKNGSLSREQFLLALEALGIKKNKYQRLV